MLNYIFLSTACFLSIELCFKMKLLFYFITITKTLSKAIHVILAQNISDHWKEKVLQKYAFNIFKNSLLVLSIFLLVIMIFLSFAYLSSNFLDFLFSPLGFSISIIISLSYIKFRAHFFSE